MKKFTLTLMLLTGIIPLVPWSGLTLLLSNEMYAQETFESQTEVEAQQQAMEACGCWGNNWNDGDNGDDPNTEPTVIVTRVPPSAGPMSSFSGSNTVYGVTAEESVELEIGASKKNGQWTAVLLGITGNYSVQTRLIPGVKEVGNTGASNFCAQVRDLRALTLGATEWYMISAVDAHEDVHVSRLLRALNEGLPNIQSYVRVSLSVADNGQTKQQAIAQLKALPQFNDVKKDCYIEWYNSALKYRRQDHMPTGAAYNAERGIVTPVWQHICSIASDQTPPWPTCNYCP